MDELGKFNIGDILKEVDAILKRETPQELNGIKSADNVFTGMSEQQKKEALTFSVKSGFDSGVPTYAFMRGLMLSGFTREEAFELAATVYRVGAERSHGAS